ncbi:peptidylprolyl isomerase [Gaetbulibacter saemankumensis]|uniref:peptidylprolyl isomerase n=1 Tax=Gaetbulibacter saemankumensis TaxID=311208 RepID=UPI000416C1E4|nr:peptidylprolyl isomerase [Gaetbulibacter saemankumensis]
MDFKYLLFALFLAFSLKIEAQSENKEILFSVDGEPVYVSEFIRVYNKNLDLVQDENQKDVDEYLTLFTNYKLKIKEARALGLDKKPSYNRELTNYRKQLANNYITDTKVTDALIEEAYERVSYDVKASHILVKVGANASPEDSLAAYNSIVKLRNRALTEGFDVVRKEVHNGQTIYGEDLGWFSGFKMVYKFECAAYNTSVGDVSQPFRTQFGYHIVNVIDKRKSRGEVTVAHIMIANKLGNDASENPEERIQNIYQKLNQGDHFETLAKQFSDDKNSAAKGGKLTPFSSGQLNSVAFEDVAFGLENVGDISEPFQTNYGWHIVKLINKKPVPPFTDLKPSLEQQVKRDARSKLIDDALHQKLRNKYQVGNKQPALDYFAELLDDSYFTRSWKLPPTFEADASLVKIGEEQLYFRDFGAFLERNQHNINSKESFNTIVSKAYNEFINSNLVRYQEEHLENENEDFAFIVSEYRDGLLLFDLMETTIWNVAQTDSLALKDYYESHKENYVFPERIDAVVASSENQKALKKVAKLSEQGLPLEEIKSLVNSNDKIDVLFTVGIMSAEHQALPEGFEFKKGVSKIYKHHGAYVIASVKEVLPSKQKTFDDAKGAVIVDYQNDKEQKWLAELSEKYKVEINEASLNKIKSQLNK